MNRRLFVSQLTAGLAFYGIPTSLMASAIPNRQGKRLTITSLDKAAEWIAGGHLGSPQRLTISHVYSPELTSRSLLLGKAQEAIEQAGYLLGTTLPIDTKDLLADSPSAAFGSYATRFEVAGITLIWQALARIGGKANEPATALRLYGSKGILQTVAGEDRYQLSSFKVQGPISDTQPRATYALTELTRRHFLGV